MRRKVSGIAALAALAVVVVLIAAAPASAAHSVFCQENAATCPEAKQFPTESWLVSTLEGAGVYGEFEFPGFMTISSCGAGKVSGMVQAHKEGPITGEVVNFYISNCLPGGGCEVNTGTVKLPWEFTATGGGNGSVVISSPTVTASCNKFPWNFKCVYSAASTTADFEGGLGEKAFIRTKETAFSLVSGTGCFSTKANLRIRTLIREPSWSSPIYLTN